jgi:RNA polymerase sigma factor (sigma-70 family)
MNEEDAVKIGKLAKLKEERKRVCANPFASDTASDREDLEMVGRARSGDGAALDCIIRCHQEWIYNIAIRMLFHPQDAEDATQEILIKIMTRLASFEGRSGLRTWIYRIAFNHLLNTRRGRFEKPAVNFRFYGEELDGTPTLDPPDPTAASPEANLLATETMLACTTGMLLCLDREQRLAYILGAIFRVSGNVAAEVLEITTENFRQRLARARRDLGSFMNEKCGLVNPANSCQCARKTRGFIRAGHVDPDNLLFVGKRVIAVREAAPRVREALETALDEKCADVFRAHPFFASPDVAPAMRRLLADSNLRRATEI